MVSLSPMQFDFGSALIPILDKNDHNHRLLSTQSFLLLLPRKSSIIQVNVLSSLLLILIIIISGSLSLLTTGLVPSSLFSEKPVLSVVTNNEKFYITRSIRCIYELSNKFFIKIKKICTLKFITQVLFLQYFLT